MFDKKNHLLVFKHLESPTVPFLSLLLLLSIDSIASISSIVSIASIVPVFCLLVVIIASAHLLFLNIFPLLFAQRLKDKFKIKIFSVKCRFELF